MTDTKNPAGTVPAAVTYFFRAVLAAAVILALTILLLPGPDFLAYSNYLQIVAAIAGALVFLYCWNAGGRKEALFWAAGGLGLWGIANIAWYVNVMMGLRALVFPSLIDLGMILSFLLLAEGARKGFRESDVSPYLPLGIVAACFLAGAGVMAVAGANLPSLVTLLYFLACGILVAAGVRYPGLQRTELFLGLLLFAIAFIAYPLREMFFVHLAFLNIIGTLVAAGFALIVTGWLAAGNAD